MSRIRFALAVIVVASIPSLLTSCSRRSTVTPPTLGPISATGTLLRADVSLIRRGSHILAIDGVRRYFVESKTQSLRDFEGRTVGIQGTVEANTSPSDLPVIVVKSVTTAIGSEDLHIWNIPALNIRLTTPQDWTGDVRGKVASFSLRGETVPLLTIRLQSGSSLPPGTSFYVKNRPAVRTEPSGSTVQEVLILERGTIISLHFDPTTQASVVTADEASILEAEFERVLSDISFLTDTKLKSQPTGSGSGILCGGEAGILCGAGSYCNISDPATGVGTCVSR